MSVYRRPANLELMIRQFSRQSGLYVTGAGASAGDVVFGASLMTDPTLTYIAGGSFPATVPVPSDLNRRLMTASQGLTGTDITGRELRLGTDDIPVREFAIRMPNFFGRVRLKHVLAKPRYDGRVSANYAAFRRFRRGLIANYNHDGLAGDICGDAHRVLDMHGTVQGGYGSPEMARFLDGARDFDLAVPSDELLMCAPERLDNVILRRRLLEVLRFNPDFVAVIGYSFGRLDDGVDDGVSLDWLSRRFRHYTGNIYVIDPNPDGLVAMLEDKLQSRVFSVKAYWNVLAHAVLRRPMGMARSLNYNHEALLDRGWSRRSFDP